MVNEHLRVGLAGVLYPVAPSLARQVVVDEHYLHVFLKDGRIVSVPFHWFPRLREATPEQRQTVEIWSRGSSLHWEELDEDLSVAGLLGQKD